MNAPPPAARPKAVKFDPPIGEPPAVQFFGIERLQVDSSYQRGTHSAGSRRLIEEIARKWDWRLCTPLLIAARDGGLYIIDGQHRWEAARLRGDIPYLPCAVGNYTGSAEEAALFVAANRHRVRVNALDMWRAGVAAGDGATVTIDSLVRGAGLTIARSPHHWSIGPGELLCTKALYTALRIHGAERTGAALAAIGAAFAGQVITYSGLIFAAVLGFFTKAPEGFRLEFLADTLEASSAEEWASHPALAGIIGSNPRSAALRKAMLEVMAMLADDEDQEEAA